MGKLHELLAVEPDLKKRAQRAISSATNLFTDGRTRLMGQSRHYVPLDEGGKSFPSEIAELATTVRDALSQFQSGFGDWVDASIQKEVTNQTAVANIIVDDEVIVANLPATALLNLEAKLEQLRTVYAAIPTFDPTEKWEWDENLECWVLHDQIKYRTQKVMENHILAEATEHHPAQVQTYTKDVRVGEWNTTLKSGAISPVEKHDLLERVDKLARAVKQARRRANDVQITDVKVVGKLFDFLAL